MASFVKTLNQKAMIKKIFLLPFLVGFLFTSCNDDDEQQVPVVPEAGMIAGGPFSFCIDGTPDFVSGVILNNPNAQGTNRTWVITDDAGNILGLPPTIEALEAVNFEDAGPGICFIWYLRYEDGLSGLATGQNVDDLIGNFDLSNSIQVDRNQPNAGTIIGGPFAIAVNGEPSFVTDISLDATNAVGSSSTWIITDDQGNILGLPPTLDAVKQVNFDEAGPGKCFIWYMRYEGELTGASQGMNVADLEGCFSISNSVEVDRITVEAGTISGGPYDFCVDGQPDNATSLALNNPNAAGINSTWVITDDLGNILGLPPTLMAAQNVDFDEAGPGVCFIWYLRYEDGLTGLMAGANIENLNGVFDFSNLIQVNRNQPEAGTISGGPYTFTVDGTPDFVTGLMLDNSNASGSNSTWVITDDLGNILGLPPTLDAVGQVNFDDAGTGVCLIWYLRFEDGLIGAEVGMNANNLQGCFDLSNPITVTRN